MAVLPVEPVSRLSCGQSDLRVHALGQSHAHGVWLAATCYLLGEGYAKTFKELMETTDWDRYGVGNYEKCANCMVHSGFEATAVADALKRPWQLLRLALWGVRTTGAMAPEISLAKQRPAEFVFARHVEHALADIEKGDAEALRRRRTAAR